MRDNNGAGVFKQYLVGEGAKAIHLTYGIIVMEDAMKLS